MSIKRHTILKTDQVLQCAIDNFKEHTIEVEMEIRDNKVRQYMFVHISVLCKDVSRSHIIDAWQDSVQSKRFSYVLLNKLKLDRKSTLSHSLMSQMKITYSNSHTVERDITPINDIEQKYRNYMKRKKLYKQDKEDKQKQSSNKDGNHNNNNDHNNKEYKNNEEQIRTKKQNDNSPKNDKNRQNNTSSRHNQNGIKGSGEEKKDNFNLDKSNIKTGGLLTGAGSSQVLVGADGGFTSDASNFYNTSNGVTDIDIETETENEKENDNHKKESSHNTSNYTEKTIIDKNKGNENKGDDGQVEELKKNYGTLTSNSESKSSETDDKEKENENETEIEKEKEKNVNVDKDKNSSKSKNLDIKGKIERGETLEITLSLNPKIDKMFSLSGTVGSTSGHGGPGDRLGSMGSLYLDYMDADDSIYDVNNPLETLAKIRAKYRRDKSNMSATNDSSEFVDLAGDNINIVVDEHGMDINDNDNDNVNDIDDNDNDNQDNEKESKNSINKNDNNNNSKEAEIKYNDDYFDEEPQMSDFFANKLRENYRNEGINIDVPTQIDYNEDKIRKANDLRDAQMKLELESNNSRFDDLNDDLNDESSNYNHESIKTTPTTTPGTTPPTTDVDSDSDGIHLKYSNENDNNNNNNTLTHTNTTIVKIEHNTTENDNGGASTIITRFGTGTDTFELGIDGTNLLAHDQDQDSQKHNENNPSYKVKEMSTSPDSIGNNNNVNKSLIDVTRKENGDIISSTPPMQTQSSAEMMKNVLKSIQKSIPIIVENNNSNIKGAASNSIEIVNDSASDRDSASEGDTNKRRRSQKKKKNKKKRQIENNNNNNNNTQQIQQRQKNINDNGNQYNYRANNKDDDCFWRLLCCGYCFCCCCCCHCCHCCQFKNDEESNTNNV